MSRGIMVAIISAVLIGLIVAGCGSSSSDAAPLTKAQFLKQGEAICEKRVLKRNIALEDTYHKELDKNFGEGKLDAPVEEKFISDKLLPQMHALTEELDDLGVPEGDEDRVQAIVDGLEEANEEIEENPAGLLTSAETPYADADRIALAYGLRKCAAI